MMLDEKDTPEPTSVVRVDFYGQALESWRDVAPGTIYVAMRRLCDNMGLAWSPQYTKLRQSHLFKGSTSVMEIVTEAGMRDVIGLNLDLLPAWLLGLHPDKVAPDIRDSLTRYQRECVTALRNYWLMGTATRTETPTVDDPDLRAIVALVQYAQDTRAIALRADAKADAAANTAAVALDAQQWITIRQYVSKYTLDRQVPRELARRFGVYLTRHCHNKGIPVYEKVSPVFGHENEYPENIIRTTLPRWLARREAQGSLEA